MWIHKFLNRCEKLNFSHHFSVDFYWCAIFIDAKNNEKETKVVIRILEFARRTKLITWCDSVGKWFIESECWLAYHCNIIVSSRKLFWFYHRFIFHYHRPFYFRLRELLRKSNALCFAERVQWLLRCIALCNVAFVSSGWFKVDSRILFFCLIPCCCTLRPTRQQNILARKKKNL